MRARPTTDRALPPRTRRGRDGSVAMPTSLPRAAPCHRRRRVLQNAGMELTPAQHFDAWYADMDDSPSRDEIVRRTLGLPPGLESSSLLGWDGIADVTAALALEAGDVLLDLACGRGGYGREIAQRTMSRLVGVDFSAVAIERARVRAQEVGLDAAYLVG